MRPRAWVAAALLSAAGCTGHDVDFVGVDPYSSRKICTRPIAEFCGPGGCASYDQDVATLENEVSLAFGYACTSPLFPRQTGTCSALRYIWSGNPYGGTLRYYDESGTLVAAQRTDDEGPSLCDDPPYGFRPDCAPTITRDLCREPRVRAHRP